jgi:hypothetical protein
MKFHPFYSYKGFMLCVMAVLSVISSYVLPLLQINKNVNRCMKIRPSLPLSALNMFKSHHRSPTPADLYGAVDGLDIAKIITNAMKASKHPWMLVVFARWKLVPKVRQYHSNVNLYRTYLD